MFDVLQLHQALAREARPSGAEQTGIAAVLKEMAAPYVDEITSDAMGNLICHKKGEGKKVMLCAHMDAIGFMVTGIDEKGFLSITNIGWHDPAEIINARVQFPGGLHGIIRPRERAKTLSGGWTSIKMTDLYVDIGATSYADAAKKVKIGDMAVFEGMPHAAGPYRIQGPYADDLIGCVVLLLAMEELEKSPYDVYFVFSTQEEVGLRGAKTAALAIQPDIAIACDVCDSDDTPLEDKKTRVIFLGKGPAIKIKDSSVICNPALNEALKKAAKKAELRWQDEIMLAGGTDTAAMQLAGPDTAATCISIPTRYIHSPGETYDWRDVEQAAAMLAAFLKQ